MADPKLNYLSCSDSGAGHRMAYWEWGAPDAAHTVVCVHGLSRQGRDFDVLAQALVAQAGGKLRVVCPDVVGRGQSDWLADPMGYQVPAYAADMLALLMHLKPQTLDWVGTSMGGLIGMAVTAHAASVGMKVRKLVLNDVGPTVQWDSIVRIAAYLGKSMQFESLQQAADAMWSISTSFGPHTPAQWLELSRHMVKPATQGGVTLHYDPAIAVPVRAMTQEMAAGAEAMVWQLYDAIQADTLLLRGAVSDLLSPHTAQQMTERGPKARLVEFAGIGHAPTLIADDQVQAVASFLLD
ncbi:alpha/beta fold hydrolase [Rhodoferax saidenbachensis]|uniref:Alpha/beta hydrolase n=1 Tax=Rhodoferax saidenbachensis TaxID=1484693 RepID=A0A1P8K9R6_9BURK|nr:alpha/beta hydrolase [Rhodoferax saidenbachensis]APW42736.1 alpha/beta hydrolase [Rhodoferax saidenbachensis]